ncbi:MAG: tRNA 2-thiouridine(34) synthase MnmA [Candidatus Vogelbacteria bacterium]|nr:tRNA 2-thiouridine(34) synthase MnmA [Candidatus Vogelbacteria bacterium]
MKKEVKKVCPEQSRRVFVGMSGGVDSSVSAYLLKEAGYTVTGVFIRAWEPAGYPCSWRAERREAMRVASFLDIPLLTIDLSREYKKRVVDYLLAEYKAGRTPNPDVMCNKMIKFGAFFDWATRTQTDTGQTRNKRRKLPIADFVATGHYSQIKNKISKIKNTKQKEKDFEYLMQISKDKEKDQTYFLWAIEKSKLPKILFPVGHLLKSEVREIARKANLPTAEKKDSQGLCFVGQFDFKEFLLKEIGAKPGNVLDGSGQIIGEHSGAYLFTNGERHGFKIFHKQPDEKPYYVVSKDLKKNTITVSAEAKITGATKIVKLEKTNWLSGIPEVSPLGQVRSLLTEGSPRSNPRTTLGGETLKARIRYRQPLQPCHLEIADSQSATVTFDSPQIIASGQSLVLYDKEVCLGGGIIV